MASTSVGAVMLLPNRYMKCTLHINTALFYATQAQNFIICLCTKNILSQILLLCNLHWEVTVGAPLAAGPDLCNVCAHYPGGKYFELHESFGCLNIKEISPLLNRKDPRPMRHCLHPIGLQQLSLISSFRRILIGWDAEMRKRISKHIHFFCLLGPLFDYLILVSLY